MTILGDQPIPVPAQVHRTQLHLKPELLLEVINDPGIVIYITLQVTKVQKTKEFRLLSKPSVDTAKIPC